MITYPTHLTCPYCPAQSRQTGLERWLYTIGDLMQYICPAKHVFYAGPESKEKISVIRKAA